MGTIISGIIWITIFIAIGMYGVKLGGTLGTVVSYAGWLFAFLSVMHVLKVITYTIKGIKMMKEDPERFNKLRSEYHNAMNRLDGDE
jgi:hypothetical protein